jgi:DNA-binding NtrC family response regulator
MGINESSLETLQSHAAGAAVAEVRVPALTIGYHPDLRRVGERALLSELTAAKAVPISRTAPEFTAPTSSEGRELADRHLSRRAVVLSQHPDGYLLDRSDSPLTLTVDGAQVERSCVINSERLASGVVIELGDRVVLVLHLAGLASKQSRHGGLVGVSDEIAQVRGEISKVAAQPVPVLLRGESGVGKELAARALHDGSLRKDRAYVSLNMAAVVATTAASELFGHEAGAFTGASRRHQGCFGEAEGGTLFLDEIGATGTDVQAMLLRALETGEVRSVGAQAARHVDVRVISATDSDLEKAVEEGEFRLPLLHRLAVYEIVIPPLRRRRCDIGVLLVHFLRTDLGADDAARLLDADEGEHSRWLPASLVAQLMRHNWPGHVRQLRNTVRQLVIAGRGEPVVKISHAVQRLLDTTPSPTGSADGADEPTAVDRKSKRTDLDDITDEQVAAALRQNRFKVAATARELGISKYSMYQLMQRCKTIRKAKDLTREEVLAAQRACGGDISVMAERLEVSRRGLRLRLTALGID